MIKEIVMGDIFMGDIFVGKMFLSPLTVFFPLNKEGVNDCPPADAIVRRYKPELAFTGGNKFGDVYNFRAGGHYWYGIVCYADSPPYWEKAAGYLVKRINMVEDQDVAVLLPITLQNAKSYNKIVSALERSRKQIYLYVS